MPQNGACPTCNGTRMITGPGGEYQACPSCAGSGVDPGVEVFFVYTYDVVLTASQILVAQSVVIHGDADFVWKAIAGVQSGNYRIRFGYGSSSYLSAGGAGATNDRVRNANIVGTAQFPFPVIPHIVIPRAGNILFDIEDLSVASNTVQIAFIGAKRYPSAR